MTEVPDPISVPQHQPKGSADAAERPARFTLRPIGQGVQLGPRNWLVDGIIEEKTLAVIYGNPHAGKSFLALDLACSVASGLPWLERPTHTGQAVYVACEGRNGLAYRLSAWNAAHGKEAVVHEPSAGDFDFGRRGDLDDLIKAITQLSNANDVPVKVVIIDTLSDAIPGQDENAQAVMSQVVAGCSRILSETGATVVLVHHPSKANENDLRGNSVLLARADTTLLVKNRSNSRSVITKKVREGKSGEECRFRLNEVAVPNTSESSCVVKVVKTDPTGSAWQTIKLVASNAGGANHGCGDTHADRALLEFLRGLAPTGAAYARESRGETYFPVSVAEARKKAYVGFFPGGLSEEAKRKRFERALIRLQQMGAVRQASPILHVSFSDEDVPGDLSGQAA